MFTFFIDPWAKRAKKKAAKKGKKASKKSKKNGSTKKSDPFAHLFPNKQQLKLEIEDHKPPKSALPGLGTPKGPTSGTQTPTYAPPKENIDRACQMKAEILAKIEGDSKTKIYF